LKRVIQRLLLDPLSLAVLEGKFAAGDTIAAEAKGEELEFTKG
jgi:ATP-dependent Clp protease ATP-binding subunit ClpB